MASTAFLAWFCLEILLSSQTQLTSSSSCDKQPCNIINDCAGILVCLNGNCNDDPVVNTNMCTQGFLPPPNDAASSCQPSGTLNCSGKFYPQYRCSPPGTSSTKAILTTNDFSQGGDGGYASECDNKFHDNSEPVVALSTGWYDSSSRCGKMIRRKNGLCLTVHVG